MAKRKPTTELVNRMLYDLNPAGTSHWAHRLFVERLIRTRAHRWRTPTPTPVATGVSRSAQLVTVRLDVRFARGVVASTALDEVGFVWVPE
jgi:hypothetical protein